MANISRLAVVGVLAAGGVLTAAAPAAALPGCSVNMVKTGAFTWGGEVRCTGAGTVQVRVVIDCYFALSGPETAHAVFGPWVGVPGVSTATCGVGEWVDDYYGEAIG